MKTCTLLIITLIMTGCGPAWHLKRAKYHIAKAEAKGALWKSDTLYKRLSFKVPGVHVEFTPKILTAGKPMIFVKDSVTASVLIVKGKNRMDTVYVETKCPARIIQKDVPVSVSNALKPGKAYRALWFLSGLILGMVLSGIIYYKWIRK